MSAWLKQISPRDRRALFLLLVAGVLVGGWLLLLEPLLTSRASLRQQVTVAERELSWMRGAAVELANRRAQGLPGHGDRGTQSLLGLADQSARTAGLGDGLKRVEPLGNNRVNVWLENVPFDSCAAWLEGLAASYGVGVESFQFDRAGAVGAVNARITLIDGS